MLRTVTISIIIGTFLIGAYYVASATYVQPQQKNDLALALGDIKPGLTYEKFIAMSEDEKSFLYDMMPSNTRLMLLQEAQNRPSFIAESKDQIQIPPGFDLKVAKFTEISGIKGNDAQGTASILVAGSEKFLRLEDFGVNGGIDQHIYFTKDGIPDTGIDVGLLKATQGDQNYDISGINPDEYNVMIVYSKLSDTYYAHAQFLQKD